MLSKTNIDNNTIKEGKLNVRSYYGFTYEIKNLTVRECIINLIMF